MDWDHSTMSGRRACRITVDIAVNIYAESGSVGRGINLSAAGLLIETEEAFALNQDVTLSFTLSNEVYNLPARVARLLEDKRVGFDFVDVPRHVRLALVTYVARHHAVKEASRFLTNDAGQGAAPQDRIEQGQDPFVSGRLQEGYREVESGRRPDRGSDVTPVPFAMPGASHNDTLVMSKPAAMTMQTPAAAHDTAPFDASEELLPFEETVRQSGTEESVLDEPGPTLLGRAGSVFEEGGDVLQPLQMPAKAALGVLDVEPVLEEGTDLEETRAWLERSALTGTETVEDQVIEAMLGDDLGESDPVAVAVSCPPDAQPAYRTSSEEPAWDAMPAMSPETSQGSSRYRALFGLAAVVALVVGVLVVSEGVSFQGLGMLGEAAATEASITTLQPKSPTAPRKPASVASRPIRVAGVSERAREAAQTSSARDKKSVPPAMKVRQGPTSLPVMANDKDKAKASGARPADLAGRRARIETLLTEADALFAQGTWSLPKGESALDRYREVIELEGDNGRARDGIAQVCNGYLTRAREVKAEGDSAGARWRLERALEIVRAEGRQAGVPGAVKLEASIETELATL